MKEKYPKYLPIGSVVMLEGGKKRVMVIGYVPINLEEKDKVYDYTGCLFPEGVISSNQNLLFNHDQISQIYCLGFQDEEQKNFTSKIKELLTDENIKKIVNSQQNSVQSNKTPDASSDASTAPDSL